MTAHVLAALALLVLPAAIPCLGFLGLKPTTVFLIPLVGALLSAIAAELEAAFGGSLLSWFVVLSVLANAAALVHLRSRIALVRRRPKVTVGSDVDQGHSRLQEIPWWSLLTVAVMAAAVAWPLQVLRSPIIAYDGYAIWTLHSVFIYGGHSTLMADLTNPVYRFSNPSYPPLVPSTGALGFVSENAVDLRLAVIMTAILNACALAVVGCAVSSVVAHGSRRSARVVALVAGASISLIGFGLSGVYGVGGYADLLWAASALAAAVIGVVLPRSGSNLLAACLCAIVASLTKNEGFITAALVLALISARYIPLRPRQSRAALGSGLHSSLRHWVTWLIRTASLTILMLLPAVLWYALIQYHGIGSDFVGRSTQGIGLRLNATTTALWANLHVAPLAFCVAVIGGLVLARTRSRLKIGNDLWLWAAIVGSVWVLVMTYVLGALEIHWWLTTSASRTTIFPSLALYCDMAIWLIIAVSSRSQVGGRADAFPSSVLLDAEDPDPTRGPLDPADWTGDDSGVSSTIWMQ